MSAAMDLLRGYEIASHSRPDVRLCTVSVVTGQSRRMVMRYRHAAAPCVLVAALAVAGPAAAAPSVQAYALSAAGESALGSAGGGFSCATFGPDPRTDYFSSVLQVSLPEAGCGVGA